MGSKSHVFVACVRHKSDLVAVSVGLLLFAFNAELAMAQVSPSIKAYPCPTGKVAAAVAQLRTEFGTIQGIKIAGDERTSQVIVYAAPDTQARIGQRLAVLLAGAGSASPSTMQVAGSEVVNGAPGRTIALQHSTAEQVEASLVQVVGNRLAVLPDSSPQAKHYRLTLANGQAAELTMDSALRRVAVSGSPAAADSCGRLVQEIDRSNAHDAGDTRLAPLRTSNPASIQNAIRTIQGATAQKQPRMPMAAMLFESQNQGPSGAPGQPGEGKAASPEGPKGGNLKSQTGLNSPVEIEAIDGLDVLVVRGRAQDVEQVMDIISQIERVSAETEPAIQILPLKHVECSAMAALVRSLYDEAYLTRQGSVSITAAVKPNALLIVGRPENVQTVVDLVAKLDQPVSPETQFRMFPLKHAQASSVQTIIQDFYRDRAASGQQNAPNAGTANGLAVQVRVVTDARSNAVLVQAAPRDMEEVAALIARLDVATSAAVDELRIIRLERTFAKDVVDLVQSAIGAATSGSASSSSSPSPAAAAPAGGQPGGGRPQSQPSSSASRSQSDQRSAMLRFLTVDTKGRRLIESGILNNVRLTADSQANAVLVSAPAESMELIETLIRQLDSLPAAEAQIKVFTIVSSDATSLMNTLQTLFATQPNAAGQSSGPVAAMAGTDGSLVSLRFAVDMRTNSIIASGSEAELTVVEAILMRLDDSDVRQRKNYVFRLKNSYAAYVATAVQNFVNNERNMQRQQGQNLATAFDQIEREVVVVAEQWSNCLILSATPRYFDEVKHMIEQLDERPPMVMIQVLIAEVDLQNADEFGIELGLQDGLLFDRSLLSNIQSVNTTVQTSSSTTQNQRVVSTTATPGFSFTNGAALGNNFSANNPSGVGGQGYSSFGVGRTNNTLGYGGLVLSASSESVSALLRALSQCQRLEVLQRPQVMALDNQQASIQVGQRVPRIVAASLGAGQQTNSTQSENVGLILNVTPRISPDGLVVMNIATEKSEVGPEAEGTPVSVAEGQVIRSPRINTTQAVTVVSAMTGQTVIIGGLISKSKLENHAKVPLLGDIPLLKYLFRYDSVTSSKKELLIIMSPHIVRNEAEMDAIKQAEAAKISWCLGDVVKIHGDAGLRGRTDDWSDSETQVVYPDAKPITGPDGKAAGAEAIPAPPGIPEDKLKSNSKSRTTAPQAPMPVPTPAPAGTATTGDPTSYIPPQQAAMGNVQQVSYQSVSTQPSGVPQSYNSR